MSKPKISIEEFKAKLDRVPELEFVRLAAFIDGEGCITIARSPRRGRMAGHAQELVVTVSNTSHLLLDWLVRTFGGTYTIANGNKTMPVYSWRLNELQREEILRRCLSYFIIKREQAEIGLAFRDLKRR